MGNKTVIVAESTAELATAYLLSVYRKAERDYRKAKANYTAAHARLRKQNDPQ